MWAAACGQILFSLSPGCGTAITLSSYTKPKEDVLRTCLLVALSNSAFSLVGGFAIFGILGNLALKTGRTVAEVASSGGTGLAFVAIAEGIQNFGAGKNAMAVLFFVMLLSLGLDSTFAWAETMVSYVEDFCEKRGRRPGRIAVVAAVSTVMFLCGLPYCTGRGIELLDVLDHYCTSYYLLLGCCLEAIMFYVSFGWDRLKLTIHEATVGNEATPNGRTVSPFWRFCLMVTVPLMTGLLFVQLFVSDVSDTYMGYPTFLQVIGWVSLALVLGVTPLGCIMQGQSTLPAIGGAATMAMPHKDEPTLPSNDVIGVPSLVKPGQPPPRNGASSSRADPAGKVSSPSSPSELCCFKGLSLLGIIPCSPSV